MNDFGFTFSVQPRGKGANRQSRYSRFPSPQEKAEGRFDDGEIHLLANQPFAPGEGPEHEVHDRPEKTVMNIVPDHGGGQRKKQVHKARQFDF
jgi:hypothetical protein